MRRVWAPVEACDSVQEGEILERMLRMMGLS